MSEGKFEIHRAHKMLDWLENEVTEWAYGLIQEHFGVDCPSELDREQIDEVIEQWNEMTEYAGGDWLALGLRNAIGTWENENDEYLI